MNEILEILEIKKGNARSYEERMEIFNKPLFPVDSFPTDDTHCTMAIANALVEWDGISEINYEFNLKKIGLEQISKGRDRWGRSRFSKGFVNGLRNEKIGNR